MSLPIQQNSDCAFFQHAGVGCPNIVFLARWIAFQIHEQKRLELVHHIPGSKKFAINQTQRNQLDDFILNEMRNLKTQSDTRSLVFNIPEKYGGKDMGWTFVSRDLMISKIDATIENFENVVARSSADANWFRQKVIDFVRDLDPTKQLVKTNNEKNQVGDAVTTEARDPYKLIDVSYSTDLKQREIFINHILSQWEFLCENWFLFPFSEKNESQTKTQTEKDLKKVHLLAKKWKENLLSISLEDYDIAYKEMNFVGNLVRLIKNELIQKIPDYQSEFSRFFQTSSSIESVWQNVLSMPSFHLFLSLLVPQLIIGIHEIRFQKSRHGYIENVAESNQIEKRLFKTKILLDTILIENRRQREQSVFLKRFVFGETTDKKLQLQYSKAEAKRYQNPEPGSDSSVIRQGNFEKYFSNFVFSEEETEKDFARYTSLLETEILDLRKQLQKNIGTRFEDLANQELRKFSKIIFQINQDFVQLQTLESLLSTQESSSGAEILEKRIASIFQQQQKDGSLFNAKRNYDEQFKILAFEAHCILKQHLDAMKKNGLQSNRIDTVQMLRSALLDFKSVVGYWIEKNIYPLTSKRGFFGVLKGETSLNNIEYTLSNLSKRLKFSKNPTEDTEEVKQTAVFIWRLANLWKFLKTYTSSSTAPPSLEDIAKTSITLNKEDTENCKKASVKLNFAYSGANRMNESSFATNAKQGWYAEMRGAQNNG